MDNGVCFLDLVHSIGQWELEKFFQTFPRFETRGPLILIHFPYVCQHTHHLFVTSWESQKIKGIKVGRNGLSFSHLLFANDSLLFFRKDNSSLGNIQLILEWYCSILGQTIHLAKSDLYCSLNMPKGDQKALARNLQVNLVQHPSRYLGIHFRLRGNIIVDSKS